MGLTTMVVDQEHKRMAWHRTRGHGTRWAGPSGRWVGVECIRAGEPRVVVLERTPVPGTKMNAELLLESCEWCEIGAVHRAPSSNMIGARTPTRPASTK
jgi:hypothetical protein